MKKSIKKRAEKAIVTQDNRFVYAKYDMNTNELKFFLWIIAQLNSQKDTLFQVCEIPVSEIFEIFGNSSEENYAYIRKICASMLKKTYIEDFRLKDLKTMKEVNVFNGFTLFKSIKYEQGQAYITYQLNDSLFEYLMKLERNFTQIQFSDIQKMKSAYSIRIYNILMCELKQNRQSLKISLAVLQNILEVPKSMNTWDNFKQKVLNQAKKDINTKSDILLLDIQIIKTGRKVTELEFIFDYKRNDEKFRRDTKKLDKLNEQLIEKIQPFLGKTLKLTKDEIGICEGWRWENEEKKRIVILCKSQKTGKTTAFLIKSFKDLENIAERRKLAEEAFYAGNLFEN